MVSRIRERTHTPFWPASVTVGLLLRLEEWVSREPPIELVAEAIDVVLAVEPRRGRWRWALAEAEDGDERRGKG